MGDDVFRVGLIEFYLCDLAHLDAIEADFPTLAQAVDRALKYDVVERIVAIEADPGQPDPENGDTQHKDQGRQTHERVIGIPFH